MESPEKSNEDFNNLDSITTKQLRIENIERDILRKTIEARFSVEELENVAFDLEIDYQNLPTQTRSKSEKVRALIEYCARLDRLPQLFEKLKQERPTVDWYGFVRTINLQDSPYKGLERYDVTDAGLFFGREALIEELVELVHQQNFLAVIGASGSGKSSVVRAGLVPALTTAGPSTREELPPTASDFDWIVHIITPESDPLMTLASSLTEKLDSALAAAKIIDEMLEDSRSLHLWLKKLAKRETRNGRYLLVIDQFEEVFTLCRDDQKRQAFIDNLMTALSFEGDKLLTVVITLRADFYHRCADYDQLRRALESRQKYIGQMSWEELRQVIEKPAKQLNLELEEGLVEQLFEDLPVDATGKPKPSSLPLLSHALLETWKRQENGRLTIAGYAASGGIRRAITKTADFIYTNLLPEQKIIAQNIFTRLIEMGENTEPTRRRAKNEEFIPEGGNVELVNDVLQKLADARLITTRQEETEMSHEALIRAWPTLQRWLDSDREKLIQLRRLRLAAEQWIESEQNEDYLARGSILYEYHSLTNLPNVQLSPAERDFIAASEQAEERRVRDQRRAQSVSDGLLILRWTLLTAFGFIISPILSAIGFLDSAALVGGVVGITVGIFQSTILRRFISNPNWWIPVTTIGFSAGMYLSQDSEETLIHSILIGSIVGLLQWLWLRRHFAVAELWPLATLVGFLLGGTAFRNLYGFGFASHWNLTNLIQLVLFVGIGGLVIGMITGLALVQVLRNDEQIRDTPQESPINRGARVWMTFRKQSKKLPRLTRSDSTPRQPRKIPRNLVITLVFVAVLFAPFYPLISTLRVNVKLGKPALNDIFAPRSITFESEVLTEQARVEAANMVEEVYTAVNLLISREQSIRANDFFTAFGNRRGEVNPRSELGIEDLISEMNANEMYSIELDRATARVLLEISEPEYEVVVNETLRIIDLIMRSPIPEAQLAESRQLVLINLDSALSQEEEQAVAALAPQLIVPNIFIDEAATASRQEEARQSVEPVTRNISAGELILSTGEIVDEADIEALDRLDLFQNPSVNWPLVNQSLLILIGIISLLFVIRFFDSRRSRIQVRRIRSILQLSWLWKTTLLIAFLIFTRPWEYILRSNEPTFVLGQPGPGEVYSPHTVTFISQVLTERARVEAANSVANVYTPVDPQISQRQVNEASAFFATFREMRAELDGSDPEIDTILLFQAGGIDVDSETASLLLELTAAEFDAVENDILTITNQIMRNPISEERLNEYKRSASLSVSFDLTSNAEQAATALASKFIVANTFIDETATARQREEAAAAVEPVTQSITAGQIILRSGEIIDEEDFERLERLGLTSLNSPQFYFLITLVLVAAVLWLFETPIMEVKESNEIRNA